MTEKFDINSWMEQGKQAIEALYAKKTDLEEQLVSIKAEIKDMEKTMGMSAPRARRVRIRPLVKALLEENRGKRVALDAVIAHVKANAGDVPVEDDAILQAVDRAVKDIEEMTLTDKGLMIK